MTFSLRIDRITRGSDVMLLIGILEKIQDRYKLSLLGIYIPVKVGNIQGIPSINITGKSSLVSLAGPASNIKVLPGSSLSQISL